MKYFVNHDGQGQEFCVDVKEIAEDIYELSVEGQTFQVDWGQVAQGSLFSLLVDAKSHSVTVECQGEFIEVMLGGRAYRLRVLDETQKRLEKMGGRNTSKKLPTEIKAEMPGVVVKTQVSPGDRVKKGDVLVVVEAMKMQNEILAPAEAVVKDICVKDGEVLEAQVLLVRLDYDCAIH